MPHHGCILLHLNTVDKHTRFNWGETLPGARCLHYATPVSFRPEGPSVIGMTNPVYEYAFPKKSGDPARRTTPWVDMSQYFHHTEAVAGLFT